jgi:hypothetical protein
MKIKVVFDGGIEKIIDSDFNIDEISDKIGEMLDSGDKIEEIRLDNDGILIPYNKILYIEEVK